MKENIDNLIKTSLTVLTGFKNVEPREWGVEGTLLELTVEIGSLGRMITIFENYRHGDKSRHQLADELSDILFVLIRLGVELNIALPQAIDVRSVSSPEQAYFSLFENTNMIRTLTKKAENISEEIAEMLSIVWGLSEYYKINLKMTHLEEMKLASLWQRLFFNQQGGKKIFFRFPKKLYWKFSDWKHRIKVEMIHQEKNNE